MNRKGFTLVELLAVIILLAVIVGITIPAILTTADKAKAKSFQAAADAAADWFTRQYQMVMVGVVAEEMTELDANFETICGTGDCTRVAGVNGATETGITFDTTTGSDDEKKTAKTMIAAVGLKVSNISKMHVYIDETSGRTCVTLSASTNGDYYNVVTGNQLKGGSCY